MTIVVSDEKLGFIDPLAIQEIIRGKYNDIQLVMSNGTNIEIPRHLTNISLVKNRIEAIQTLSKHSQLPEELNLLLDKLLNPQDYSKEDLNEISGVYFSEREMVQYKNFLTYVAENDKQHEVKPDKKIALTEKMKLLIKLQNNVEDEPILKEKPFTLKI